MTKPLHPPEIAAEPERWITDAARIPGEEASAAGEADEQVLDATVVENLRDLDASSPGLLSTVARTFIEDTLERLDQIDAALTAGDAEALARLAHTVKGSAQTLGARGLAAACESLELAVDSGNFGAARESAEAVHAEFALAQGAVGNLAQAA